MKKYIVRVVFVLVFIVSSCGEEEILVYKYPDLCQEIIQDAIYEETCGIQSEIVKFSDALTESIETMQDIYKTNFTDTYYGAHAWFVYDYSNKLEFLDGHYEYNSQAKGEYETMFVFSDDSINSKWIVDDWAEQSDFVLIYGDSERNGSQYSKIYKDDINTLILFELCNIEVNRVNGKIKSGTIEFVFSGLSSYGNAFSSSGKMIYSDYYFSIKYY